MHIRESDPRGPDFEIFTEVSPGRFVHRGTCRRHKLRYKSSHKYTQSLLSKKIQAHQRSLCCLRVLGSGKQMGPGQGHTTALVLSDFGVPSSASPALVQVLRLPWPGLCWARLLGEEGR